jgi:DNA-binding CsgD family transcriptional regulator
MATTMLFGCSTVNPPFSQLEKRIFTSQNPSETDLANIQSWEKLNPDKVDKSSPYHWVSLRYFYEGSQKTIAYINVFMLDSVEVYKRTSQGYQLLNINNGYLVPPLERELPIARSPIIPLPTDPGANQFVFLVKNSSKYSQRYVPFSFRNGFQPYLQKDIKFYFKVGNDYQAVLLGFLTALLLFNLAFFTIAKEIGFGYLIIYNLGDITWVLLYGGLVMEWAWVADYEQERLLRHLVPVNLLMLGYYLMASYFLQLKKQLPILFYVLTVFLSINLLSIPLLLLGYSDWGVNCLEIAIVPIILTVFISSIILYRKGQREPIFFIIQAAIFLFGATIYGLGQRSNLIDQHIAHFISTSTFLIELFIFIALPTTKFFKLKEKSVELKEDNQSLKLALEKKEAEMREYLLLQAALLKTENDMDNKDSVKQNWQEFKSRFELLYPNLLAQAVKEFKLTPNEERLFAYTKLRMRDKEIAVVQNTTTRAVEKARERMKKKIPGDNVQLFIQGYEVIGS